jgi:hypothetical protein
MMNTNIDQTLEAFNNAIKDLVNAAHQPVAQEITTHIEFRAKKGESNAGKGILWIGEGNAKQLVFNPNPDRFFASESIDLGKDKHLSVSGVKVIDGKELGPSVTKSNLQQLGRLKGLIVDGPVNINQHLIYNTSTDRLGLGTDLPNAAISVAEQGIEVMLGTSDALHGMVGTFSNVDFDVVVGNVPRITVSANGNIVLGNFNRNPIQVKVNGKLSVGIETPDPAVDLHVAGPVRLNNHIQMYASAPPKEGTYTKGDIVWNDAATVGRNVGWICLTAGSPGAWYPFGEIKDRHF